MKNSIEELLNELIKRGRKPFNVDCAWTNVEVINRLRDNQYLPEHTKIIFKTENHYHVFDCDIRDLVSKSSWLWKFCAENKLVNRKRQWTNWLWWEPEKCFNYEDCEYWLIECALKDEKYLEKFLLDNIKCNEKSKEKEQMEL